MVSLNNTVDKLYSLMPKDQPKEDNNSLKVIRVKYNFYKQKNY